MAKILIVEDDPLVSRMYQTKFLADEQNVELAADGEEGYQKALIIKPDLILLDIMMPNVDGLEMLKRLKANPDTKAIPVILLTNVAGSEADIEYGLSLGAVSYLVKAQYTPKEVVQKVKEILSGYTHEVPTVKTKIKKAKQE